MITVLSDKDSSGIWLYFMTPPVLLTHFTRPTATGQL